MSSTPVAEQSVAIAVDGARMPAFVARPAAASDTTRAGILVVHEIVGLNGDIREISRRMAAAGYVALAPDLTSAGAPKVVCIARMFKALSTGEGPALRSLEAARATLAAEPDVDENRIGIIGFCIGGGFALAMAAGRQVQVAASSYGPVPPSLEAAADACPVVGSYGTGDKRFLPEGQKLEAKMRSLDVPHDIKFYEGATHSFMNRSMPRLKRLAGMRYDEAAAADAWDRILGFFAQHLGTGQAA